jgi:hypothetical protein
LNVLGFYRATAALAVCNYSTAGLEDTDLWFTERFDQALYQTILVHPTFCFGIIDQTSEKEAHFVRLSEIHRDDIVEFRGQSEDVTGDDDSVIERMLEEIHIRRLLDGHRKPSFRVIILKHGGQWGPGSQNHPGTQKLTIAFIANHAIADALSMMNFFTTFFKFFNDLTPASKLIWPVRVPTDLRHPALLEDFVDLLARDETAPPTNFGSANIWSGSEIFMNSLEDFTSCVRLITIPHHSLNDTLKFCKFHKVTLTGLLNALLVVFLSRECPTGYAFRSITPYSMRYLTKVGGIEVCNHASAMVSEYPQTLVESARLTKENYTDEIQVIVDIALGFRKEMAAELARSPKNNIFAGMVGVKDWYSISEGQLGTKRAVSFGMSNLGSVAISEPPKKSEDVPLKLEKVIISQYVFSR